jgi:hypothetical protein
MEMEMRMRDLIDVVEMAQNPPSMAKQEIERGNGRQLHDTPLERARQRVREQTFGTPGWEEAMQVVRDIIAANKAKRR